MLEAEGYSASEAADGTQALELARQSPPDLILLDIMMPGMDGYEVARQLKTAAATRSVPVIMVTALDDRESRLRGLEAGANVKVRHRFFNGGQSRPQFNQALLLGLLLKFH